MSVKLEGQTCLSMHIINIYNEYMQRKEGYKIIQQIT